MPEGVIGSDGEDLESAVGVRGDLGLADIAGEREPSARPPQVQWGPVAHRPGVGFHETGNTAPRSTVLTVAVRLPVSPPRPAAAASALGVLVGRVEDVTGLMGEHPIDVVRTPTIVVVAHDEPRPPEGGVREVTDWILGEECAVAPTRAKPRPHVIDVGRAAGNTRSESHLRQRRVAPQCLLGGKAERIGSGRDVQRHDLDVIGERDVRSRIAGRQPAQPVLDLGDDLDPFGGAELQVVGRALDHHDPDRHRPDEICARRSRVTGGEHSG